MQIGDALDGFFYPTLTLMMDSYNPDSSKMLKQNYDTLVGPCPVKT